LSGRPCGLKLKVCKGGSEDGRKDKVDGVTCDAGTMGCNTGRVFVKRQEHTRILSRERDSALEDVLPFEASAKGKYRERIYRD
jgi:hypothetical protein